MKKALVTGGAGFIGSHVVEELLRRKYDVVVLDDLSTGKRANIKPFSKKITFIRGDIRNPSTVKQAMHGVQYVLHLAALVSVEQSVANSLLVSDVNVKGTLVVLEAARQERIARLVFASSSAIYGTQKHLVKETDTPAPQSPYAVSKLSGEHYCQVYSHLFGIPIICLRYFNVIGPWQNYWSEYGAVLPRLTQRLLQGKPAIIYGSGEQRRDFTPVTQVVAANLAALEKKKLAKFDVMNIASGHPITINQLYEELQKILGTSRAPIYEPVRPGDIQYSGANIARAKRLLGYRPVKDLHNTLTQAIAWYKAVLPSPSVSRR